MKISTKYYFLIFITSAIFISTQIILIQIFTYEQFYHFASMIISFALLGLGLSGILLSLFQKFIQDRSDEIILSLIILNGFYTLVTSLIQREFIQFDSYLIFYDSSQLLKFVLIGMIYSLQFTFFACLIGLFFVKYSKKSNQVYFINLLGSAFGGLFTLILMWMFDIQVLHYFNSLLMMLGGSLLLINLKSKVAHIIFSIFLIFNIYFLIYPIELKPSQYKGIARTLNLPDAKIIHKQNSPYGKIEIVESALFRYSPGLSLNFTDTIPRGNIIFSNGDPVGFLLQEYNYEFLKHSTLFLPYIFNKSKVLLLNSSGGFEIYRALQANIDSIFCIEQHPLITQLLDRNFSNSLFNDHRFIKVIHSDPRIFIETTREKFDIIFHPPIEPYGVSSGLFALQEKYLLTVESFKKCLELINENGFFSVSVYIDYPYRNILKLLSLINQSIENKNKFQIFAIKNWNVITFLIKKGEFSLNEISSIKFFCNSNQFDILIGNGQILNNQIQYNLVQDTSLFSFMSQLLPRVNNEFIKYYPFNINTPTDDKPFYSNFIRPEKILMIKEKYPIQLFSYIEIGYFLIWVTFGLIILSAIILLTLSFITVNNIDKISWSSFFYFALIGLGFMIFEITMIQKMVLFLSNNIYSVTFVICSILLFAGIGSLTSSRIKLIEKKNLIIVLVLIFITISAVNLISSSLIRLLAEYNFFIKYFVAFIIIGCAGFFMGMPFPLGIRYYSEFNRKLVAFSWGVNGSFSVIGSILAVILSLTFGFKITLFLAGFFYLLNMFIQILILPKSNL